MWIALHGNIPIWNFNLVIYKIHEDQFPVEFLTGWYQTTHIKKGHCIDHFKNQIQYEQYYT